MMEFQTKPLYVQVSEALFAKIASKEWNSGAALPNEFQLSTELKVSIGTVRKAVELLERDGFVVRRQGKGTFVTDPDALDMRFYYDPIRNADGSRVEWRYISHDIDIRPSTSQEQKRFKISSGAPIAKINRLRAIGSRPAMLCSWFIPSERFPDLSSLSSPDTAIVSLARAAGIHLGATEEVVDICPASDEASKALSIERRTPILRIQRVVHDSDDVPIQASVSQCHLVGEQYRAPVTRLRDHVARSEDRFLAKCELKSLKSFE